MQHLMNWQVRTIAARVKVRYGRGGMTRYNTRALQKKGVGPSIVMPSVSLSPASLKAMAADAGCTVVISYLSRGGTGEPACL